VGSRLLGAAPEAVKAAGTFDRSATVLGSDNETVLKRAAGPQIVPVYGTDFRSTPVFFLQDDHDYFDNDEATDEIVTFPPSYFMLQLARTTQSIYYPEFLPDSARPLACRGRRGAIGWRGCRRASVRSASGAWPRFFSTTSAELRPWPARAPFISTPRWKMAQSTNGGDRGHSRRPRAIEPPGWTAGKWGEWYPDVLGREGKLTTNEPSPIGSPGWLKQHDRLIEAMAAVKTARTS